MSNVNPHALVKAFEDSPENDFIDVPKNVSEAFTIRSRNWNTLVDTYNVNSKKKFPFTALECKTAVEYVKRAVPLPVVFKSLGVGKTRLATLFQDAIELEENFDLLFNKEELSEEETKQFHFLMRHPLRILISDVSRAEGVADIMLWDRLNAKAYDNPNLLLDIMRVRFKEMFNEKTPDSASTIVQVNVAGDWVSKLDGTDKEDN